MRGEEGGNWIKKRKQIRKGWGWQKVLFFFFNHMLLLPVIP
jgi:hypothetical protein